MDFLCICYHRCPLVLNCICFVAVHDRIDGRIKQLVLPSICILAVSVHDRSCSINNRGAKFSVLSGEVNNDMSYTISIKWLIGSSKGFKSPTLTTHICRSLRACAKCICSQVFWGKIVLIHLTCNFGDLQHSRNGDISPRRQND